MKNLTERQLNMGILGLVLAVLALGSMFSIDLVGYAYYVLIAATIILVNYVSDSIVHKKVRHLWGFIGMLLLVLFFGIQTPQAPFKIYILILGVILTIPALFNVVRK